MQRREFLSAAAVAATWAPTPVRAEDTVREAETGYLNVNGLRMYFERHGRGGTPLVLLHGTFSGIGTSFAGLLPRLSAGREVIAFELQGHGRTADIDRPLELGALAGDVSMALDQLGVGACDVLGYSLGAGVALTLVLRRPERVRRAVLMSLAYSKAGYPPAFLDAMDTLTPEMFAGSPWQQEYAALAPRPEDFPRLLGKIKAFNADLEDFSEGDLGRIRQPCLLISGDADNASVAHMESFWKLLGGGLPTQSGASKTWLQILPGTSHITVPAKSEMTAPAIEAFLSA